MSDANPPNMVRRHGSTESDQSMKGDGGSLLARTGDINISERTLAIIALIAAVAALVWLAADRNHLSETLTLERQSVRELLARDHETQMKELDAIKRKYDLLDSDWMQMNGYLAANGVHKDAGGFYVKDGKRLSKEQGHER